MNPREEAGRLGLRGDPGRFAVGCVCRLLARGDLKAVLRCAAMEDVMGFEGTPLVGRPKPSGVGVLGVFRMFGSVPSAGLFTGECSPGAAEAL